MNVETIVNAVSKFAFKSGLIKRAPEILMGMGISAIGGGIIFACKGTLEIDEVVKKHKETATLIKTTRDSEDWPEYDKSVATKDLAKLYVETGSTILKVYSPAFMLTVFGIGCFFKSHNILTARNAGLVAAYKAVSESFEKYRKRVIEDYGEETDAMYRLGIYKKDGKIIEKDENGKKKKIDVSEIEFDKSEMSDFAIVFDEVSSKEWQPVRSLNRNLIEGAEKALNNKLYCRGYVFLNEVRKAVGCREKPEGQLLGWTKKVDENGNMINRIDLGITDFSSFGGDRRKMFMNLDEDAIVLYPNVEGVIFDLIGDYQ